MVEGLQWQKDLPSSAAWPDVVREIEYRFWRGGGASEPTATDSASSSKAEKPGIVMNKLDALYLRADNLWTEHCGKCKARGQETPSALAAKWSELKIQCQVINTEEYCVRQYEDLGNASVKKLRKRQTQAVSQEVKFWDRVHPLVTAKVREVTGM